MHCPPRRRRARHLLLGVVATSIFATTGCGSSAVKRTTQPTIRTQPTAPAVATTATVTRRARVKPSLRILAKATGYASYDDCTGTCKGAVPVSLRRPLHIPPAAANGACTGARATSLTGFPGPVLGSGPVYAGQASPLVATKFVGTPWSGSRVNWLAAPAYKGPILIRGGQIDGTGRIGFGEGHRPENELQLNVSVLTETGNREWPSFTRVLSPGCYAYQVDGTTFSEIIVFLVV